jgi:hypothetical protein
MTDKKYVKVDPKTITKVGKDEVKRVLVRTQKKVVDQTKSRPGKNNADSN